MLRINIIKCNTYKYEYERENSILPFYRAYIPDCQQLRLPTTFCQQLRLPTFPIANRAIAYKQLLRTFKN